MPVTSFRSRTFGLGLVFSVLLTLAACDHSDNGLTKEDYRDLTTRTPPPSAGGAEAHTEPPIPELQPILAAPPPPALEQRLVSVNVPDPSVPVRDVLIELARKVGVDLDLDPKVSGGVIIYAKDRPFAEVIDRICDMANLRYSFKDNVLRVEIDTMYNKDYRVDLPNAIRSTKMNVATSTDVFSSVQGGGGGGGANNSSSSVENDSVNDAWKEIDASLKQILLNSYPKSQPIDSNVIGSQGQQAPVTPAPTPTTPKPSAASGPGSMPATPGAAPAGTQGNAAPAAAPSGGVPVTVGNFSASTQSTSNQSTESGGTDNSGGAAAGATAGAATSPSASLSALSQLAQLQQNLINQATGATAPAPSAPAPPSEVATGAAIPSAFFSINKAAGIVSVFGTSKQQRLVQNYLADVVNKANAQVLIEAKVVEVDLNDQYKSGIDWQRAISAGGGTFSFGTKPSGSSGFLGDQTEFAKQALDNTTANAFTLAFNTGSFSSILQFVEGFGTTRTLSSPRITALNNQAAVLKVAQNQVYFSLTATVTSTPTTNGTISQTATYSSSLHTVPIGVVMTVQPEIDTEKNLVTLSLRPTVSVHSGDVADPAVALSLAAACQGQTVGACSPTNISNAVTNSNVPIVEVREMDSVVTVPSGNIVVMGGLMQSNAQKQTTGVPGAGDLPLIGNLFKVQSHETDVTELVIFLKASIVHGSDSVDWADKDLYKRYMQDPRPLAF